MTSGFMTFYKRQSSGRERKILKKSKKIEKYCQKNVRIVDNFLCVCMCAYVFVFVSVIFAYYCVRTDK